MKKVPKSAGSRRMAFGERIVSSVGRLQESIPSAERMKPSAVSLVRVFRLSTVGSLVSDFARLKFERSAH